MAPATIKKEWPLLSAIVILLSVLLLFWKRLDWSGIGFKVEVTSLASLLAPLAFASAVVERVVEILISPWRDDGADKLQKSLAAAQALPDSDAKNDQIKQAADTLDEYRGTTRRYAFAISVTLGLLVSVVGVRALEPFANPDALQGLTLSHPSQRSLFLSLDVALSGALLAGGADGVHSIMSAVTSFFDAASDKAKQKSIQAQLQKS